MSRKWSKSQHTKYRATLKAKRGEQLFHAGEQFIMGPVEAAEGRARSRQSVAAAAPAPTPMGETRRAEESVLAFGHRVHQLIKILGPEIFMQLSEQQFVGLLKL